MQKTCEDMVDVVKRKVQKDLVEGLKKMDTLFRLSSARLAETARDELLRRSSDIWSSAGKSSVLFGGCDTKVFDVSSCKSPSVIAKKMERPRIASGLKDSKKLMEGVSCGHENMDVCSV